MPRIPKPKVGNPVWMKNFGFIKYDTYEVAQTDWVEGVIVSVYTQGTEPVIRAKFDGYPTRRSASEVGEDYEWVYRKNSPTCKTIQISFINPRR